jgi:hypothetical protein
MAGLHGSEIITRATPLHSRGRAFRSRTAETCYLSFFSCSNRLGNELIADLKMVKDLEHSIGLFLTPSFMELVISFLMFLQLEEDLKGC